MSEQQHAEVMNDIKKLLPKLSNEELREFSVYAEGLQAGRAAISPVAAVQVKARKRSACSICHQGGHRAPNCPTVPKAAVAS